jgi:adenosylhomocysteinase
MKTTPLATKGLKRIQWAAKEMPVLQSIARQFKRGKTLNKITIGACLHVTTETANLVLALKDGGAKVFLCASNPLSTQDDVVAALTHYYKVPVFAKRGETKKSFFNNLNKVLDARPQVVIDDGADLIGLLHTSRSGQQKTVWGGCEETTTGVTRLKSLSKAGKLRFPVVAVNDAQIKFMFDNRYGTGQSTIDGIIRATNILIAGKKFVVAGYGWVGKGIAARAKGMGANVIVTEVDPVRALEAKMDGFTVKSMDQAAAVGNIFVTATGNRNVIDGRFFKKMQNGAILANSGHFNIEIDVEALDKSSAKKEEVRPGVMSYTHNGKSIYVIGEGRLVNLAAAEGHPSAVMDLSFAGQAKSVEFIAKGKGKLKNEIYNLPREVEQEIAQLKLSSMGTEIDKLTRQQKEYMSGWEAGT